MNTLNEPVTSVSKRKAIVFLFAVTFILTFSNSVFGQNKDEILMVADEMPVFPGGPKALMETIMKNITYPTDAFESGIEGKVILKFAVNTEGKAVLPTIAKGLESFDRQGST